jgi:hypothetical protein
MTDDQIMLMLRLTFEAGVHRGETNERHRCGQLAKDFVAPDFADFVQEIYPFPKTAMEVKLTRKGDLTGKLRG